MARSGQDSWRRPDRSAIRPAPRTIERHFPVHDIRRPAMFTFALTEAKHLLNGTKVLAISFGTDDRTKELLDCVAAVKLLDKMELASERIPAILQLAPCGADLDYFSSSRRVRRWMIR